MNAVTPPTRQLIRMRGRSYVAFVFSPVVPVAGWLEEIDATLGRSPGFFAGKPVVLDLSALQLSQSGIAHLISSLEQRGIRILGLEGVDEEHVTTSMPPLLTGGRNCMLAQNDPKESREKEQPKAKPKPASLLIESPVRSGQSVVFTEGDITVLGSVGSGAELVAGGSIHVYGALRGRAMAGIEGNAAARIFCQKIEAELLAIDGFYRTAEDISDSLRHRPAQAWLAGNVMRIEPLN
ncbi:MAG: septum site-determining protein MinC [Bradyrhizobium sp.]|uniref:septum site-determining protein MinC n=1 Tax=Bradyrhizobium sp. TaxID=376 RepID=UPI001C2924AE|nr:septum site-determining protein MinC [Bradyrhizobium sp.]MBU6463339.1 septum site-determining protein MinC [Pseudomonadota bacterium]MDE2066789.1 septum site-determining protein MinC [Bradyrhizobium sp.]MDE2242153.1 septum site-determining protein MinC [Bradyrhizobium sp.]MDE2468050.1 septum site-determining protein MinC [Bradyrhizobium sp.]